MFVAVTHSPVPVDIGHCAIHEDYVHLIVVVAPACECHPGTGEEAEPCVQNLLSCHTAAINAGFMGWTNSAELQVVFFILFILLLCFSSGAFNDLCAFLVPWHKLAKAALSMIVMLRRSVVVLRRSGLYLEAFAKRALLNLSLNTIRMWSQVRTIVCLLLAAWTRSDS